MKVLKLIMLGGLIITLAACNSTSTETEPLLTSTDVVMPDSPSDEAPGSEGGQEEPGGEDDIPLAYTGTDANMDMLDSYETTFSMTFTGAEASGQPGDFSYMVYQTISRDPQATRLLIETEGTSGSMSGQTLILELVQIEEIMYYVTSQPDQPAQCLSFSSADNVPFEGAVYTPDTFIGGGDLSGAQRILPDENVNGMMARHYRATETAFGIGYPGLSNYTVDIYVANVSGNDMIVREIFVAEGDVDGQEGQVEWTYDLLNVNVPVTIEPPEGCEPPAGADFPVMPDATNLMSLSGMISYETASPIAAVVDFYKERLPAEGWTPGAVTDNPGFVMLEFTRGEEQATINVYEGNVIVNLTE